MVSKDEGAAGGGRAGRRRRLLAGHSLVNYDLHDFPRFPSHRSRVLGVDAVPYMQLFVHGTLFLFKSTSVRLSVLATSSDDVFGVSLTVPAGRGRLLVDRV